MQTRQSTVYFAYFALVCEQLGRTDLMDELMSQVNGVFGGED
jgi:hypothetical protein